MFRRFAAAAAAVLIFAACAAVSQKAKARYIGHHPEMSAEVKAAILGGYIIMGMNEGQVTASIGMPNHVNRDTYDFGTRTQYCYDEIGFNFNFNHYRYVYFENGKVTSWSQ